MLKHSAALVSITSLTWLMSACGSSADAPGNQNGSGATGTGGTLDLGPAPGSGGSKLGPSEHDGGTVPLTPEQVEEIEGGACAGWKTEGEALPAVLMLVVDVSGSMEKAAPGSPNRSKWDITQEALADAIDTLGAQTAVGVLYYPNQGTRQSETPRDVSECVNVEALVPIETLGADASTVRRALQRSLEEANTGSGTPTHDAYQYALDNGMRAYASSAQKFMLLITDGQPTFAQQCVGTGNVDEPVDEQPIVDAIAAAAAADVRTFVIGSPGSERNESTGADARPWLSQAAEAGRTAPAGCSHDGGPYCHMDMTEEADFGAALAQGLGEVVGQINTCTYAVPPPPAGKELDLNAINLIVTAGGESELVLPDGKGSCSEGFQLNADGQIVLCEATCERVQQDSGASVQLLFGCASGEVEIPK